MICKHCHKKFKRDVPAHRLACGDSTNADDVKQLMGGALACCILTDPPYGQDQPGVPNDSPDQLKGLIDGAVSILPVKDAIAIAFQSPRTFIVWLDAVRKHGHKFERMLWLDKVAQCSYPWRGWILKSESILVSTIGKPKWNEVHPFQHDIYRLPEVSGELSESLGWHGSVKPLSVVKDIMARTSKQGSVVFDGFLGSGTTMVAAEKLGRLCYGQEIDPGYVGVCLQRLSDCGLSPRLEKR